MTIAQDFTDCVTAAEAELPGTELLPERLARASAMVLPVDGAGMSVFFADDRRLPLGASDDVSATAERLQFTVGQGPCLTAHDTGEAVVADEEELAARWPIFTDLLVSSTPIRGIIALPLHGPLEDVGALDLYLRSSDAVRSVSLADVLVVLSTLTRTFAAAMDRQPHTESGPAWLNAPPAGRRAQVWQALGMLNAGLHVRTTDAMALLRAHAYAHDTVLDDVADAVVQRRLDLDELAVPTDHSS